MPLPLPKNVRLNEKDRGIDFEVEIDGRAWKAFITFEAVDSLYVGPKAEVEKNAHRIRAVSHSSHITRKVAAVIPDGEVEPIHLTSAMFTP